MFSKKRKILLFSVKAAPSVYRYFTHIKLRAQPLTTFYIRKSVINVRYEWTVVITCQGVHCLPFCLMVKTGWIKVDRTTLIQNHVHFSLISNTGGGGQRGPLLDEFIKGWTYNLYIIDRVVPKYSEVMCFTCFNVDYT